MIEPVAGHLAKGTVLKERSGSAPIRHEAVGGLDWARRHWAGLGLTAILLLAAGLRLFVLFKMHFIYDGDEAMTGVMAKHILEGERPIFTYGMPYMAPTEAYFTAFVYALFGVSGWGMKVAPFLASLGVVALNYALGRRLIGSKGAGLCAALLTALPSLYLMVTSLRAWNHSTETILGGQILLWLTAAIIWEPTPAASDASLARARRWWGYTRREWLLWAGLGLVVGISFYGHMLAVFYYVPVVIFLFFKDKLFPFRPLALAGAVGFLAGSWPWWVYNLGSDWATIRYFSDHGGRKEAAADVLRFWFSHSWPLATGAYNYWFFTGLALALGLNVVFSLTILGWVGVRWRGLAGWGRLSLKGSRPVDLLLLQVLVSPFVYLALGQGNVAFQPLDTTGRYLLPLMGTLPVLLGGGLASLAGWLPPRLRFLPVRQRPVAAYALAGLVLLGVIGANLYQYRRADFVATAQSPYFPRLRPPVDNGPVISYLHSQGIEYATCNHWVGHRLILDSAEAVKCVDYHDLSVGGLDRFARYSAALKIPGLRWGFVLLNLEDGSTVLENRLKALGVSYTRQEIAPYLVIIPTSRPVSPTEVVEGLHYPL